MRQPLIVGVAHDYEGPRLLNRRCRERFREEIRPIIDRNTLLLIEGKYRESFHRIWHPSYLYWRWKVQRFIGVPIGYPTIGCRDGRFLERGAYVRNLVLCNIDGQYISPFIALTENFPTTFVELCNAFVHSRLEYAMTKEKNEAWLVHYCLEWLRLNALFDEPMIKAARTWGECGRHAIIICGGIHALTIHRATGWPVTYLLNTPQDIRLLANNIIAAVLYPEKVLGRTPSVSR
jgi:hypothetical protein